MELVEKIKHILEQALAVEDIKVEDDGGVICYVVSSDLHGVEFFARQMQIQRALRGGATPANHSELRRVALIAALTPGELLCGASDGVINARWSPLV